MSDNEIIIIAENLDEAEKLKAIAQTHVHNQVLIFSSPIIDDERMMSFSGLVLLRYEELDDWFLMFVQVALPDANIIWIGAGYHVFNDDIVHISMPYTRSDIDDAIWEARH